MYVTAQSVDYPRSATRNMKYETALALKEADFPQKFSGVVSYYSIGKEKTQGISEIMITDRFDNLNGFDDEFLEKVSKKACVVPTLSELVEACVDDEKGFECLYFRPRKNNWIAYAFGGLNGIGETPIEALSQLYLSLHGKKD